MLNLNTRHETIKLEKNTGKKFSDINCSSVSLSQSPKVKERKAKRKELKNETKKTHQATKGKMKSAKQHQKEI